MHRRVSEGRHEAGSRPSTPRLGGPFFVYETLDDHRLHPFELARKPFRGHVDVVDPLQVAVADAQRLCHTEEQRVRTRARRRRACSAETVTLWKR